MRLTPPAANNGGGDAHDMGMVEADHGKLDGVFRLRVLIGSGRGDLMRNMASARVQAQMQLPAKPITYPLLPSVFKNDRRPTLSNCISSNPFLCGTSLQTA